MKNYVILGIAVLCGILAFFLAHKHFLAREEALGLRGKKVNVVYAWSTFQPGEKITRERVKFYPTLKEYLLRDRVTGRYDVITENTFKDIISQGYTVDTVIEKGQPLRWIHFGFSTKTGPKTFANSITEGKRAISLPVDDTTAVSTLIRTGDRVDIIATFAFPGTGSGNQQLDRVTQILLQNVTVLSVGKDYSRIYRSARVARQRGYSNITIEVKSKEAEMLVFAMQMGKLHFALRNPDDVAFEEDTQAVQFKYLQKSIEKYIRDRKTEQESMPALK